MRKWILRSALALGLVVLAAGIAGWRASKRFEPYVREQTVSYLESRFGTGVELGSLHVSVRFLSWHPRAARLHVSGTGLKLPNRGRPDLPPLIAATKFRLETELGALWDAPRHIREVRLEKLEINVPPREKRAPPARPPGTVEVGRAAAPPVIVDAIHADGIDLRIYPADPAKLPRLCEVHALTLK